MGTVKSNSIARLRLEHQHLVAPVFGDPAAVVRALGAVQSQDYAGATWGIAQRSKGLTDAAIERAFASGAILRTHVLRPTWHFVLPEDARWMLELTAPRIVAAMAYHNRQLELDRKVFRRSQAVFERTLRDGRQLTRVELSAALQRTGVRHSTGQRVNQMLMQAELDRVIISGGRRGKQFTYALFDARVPAASPRDRDAALEDLARRYFATRGPATVQDFAWWSGLTVADAKRSVDIAAAFLARETHAGTAYWRARSRAASRREMPVGHLLANFDELVIGFRDRAAFAERLRRVRPNHRVDGLIGHVVCIDGQIVGGWRRSLGRTVELTLKLLVPLTPRERELVRQAVERYGEFLGVPVRVRGRGAGR
jgi:hypothetical protein